MSNNYNISLLRVKVDQLNKYLQKYGLWDIEFEVTSEGVRVKKRRPRIITPSSKEVGMKEIIPEEARKHIDRLWNEIHRLSRELKSVKVKLKQPYRHPPDQPRFPVPSKPLPKPPPKKRRPAIPLPRSRDEMKKRVVDLFRKAEHNLVMGKEEWPSIEEICEAAGRATVGHLDRSTTELESVPGLENMLKVIKDMELGFGVGAPSEEYGKVAYERARKALITASEHRIRDFIAWLERYPSRENITEMMLLIQQAIILGASNNSPSIRAGWEAVIKVRNKIK